MINLFQVKPSFKAPNLCFVWHELTQSVPRLVPVDVDEPPQLLVLLWGPNDLGSGSLPLATSLLAKKLQVVGRILLDC